MAARMDAARYGVWRHLGGNPRFKRPAAEELIDFVAAATTERAALGSAMVRSAKSYETRRPWPWPWPGDDHEADRVLSRLSSDDEGPSPVGTEMDKNRTLPILLGTRRKAKRARQHTSRGAGAAGPVRTQLRPLHLPQPAPKNFP